MNGRTWGIWLSAVSLLAASCSRGGADKGASENGGDGGPTDADRPSWQTETIGLDGSPERASTMAFVPGRDDELLVGILDGQLQHYRLQGDDTILLGTLDVPDVYVELDCGLLSVAFSPDDDGRVYLGHCSSVNTSRIVSLPFDASAPSYQVTPDEVLTVFEAGDPRVERPWHNVGSIGFEPNGVLYAFFGEKTQPNNARDLGNELGALLRMRPLPGGGAEPAADNPYLDDPDASDLIYAWGLRSPWMGFVDRSGTYWVGDVGEDTAEEVDRIDAPGLDLGWSLHEGPCQGDCGDSVPPIVAWGHEDDDPFIFDDVDAEPLRSRVAWAGLRYESPSTDRYEGQLSGKVLYGDMCLGFVRALEPDASGGVASDEHLMHLPFATAWRQGPDGYVYALTFDERCTTEEDNAMYGTSRLLRIVRK